MKVSVFRRKTSAGWLSPHWTYQFRCRGQIIRCATECTDRAAARRLGEADLAARLAGLTAQVQALTSPAPAAACHTTLGQILTAYQADGLEVKRKTAKTNAASLKRILARAWPDRWSDLLNAPLLETLDPDTGRRYFATWSADLQASPQESRSAKISANSMAVQAASVYQSKCLDTYRSQKLEIPAAAVADFLAGLRKHRFTRIPKRGADVPTDAVISQVLEAWQKSTDRDICIAVGFELAFGLRVSELAQARWNMLQTRDGQPYLCSDNIWDKKGAGTISIRAIDPYYSLLINKITAQAWRSDNDDDYILGANSTITHRLDAVPRAVSAWLRALGGWTGHKTNHRLRDWVGSQIAMKYGIYDASMWLRHSSVTVTQGHYTHYVTAAAMTNKDQIPIHYASPKIVQLTVLPAEPKTACN